MLSLHMKILDEETLEFMKKIKLIVHKITSILNQTQLNVEENENVEHVTISEVKTEEYD